MSGMETKTEVEAPEFTDELSDELSDEALDRTEDGYCRYTIAGCMA